jgi:hypothetical protein
MSNRFVSAIAFALWFVAANLCWGQGPTYNRSIERLEILDGPSGKTIRVLYAFQVSDPTGSALNLNADVVVEVNGTSVDVISADASMPTGGAITCAVTCAGACPSIFGDGVCTGCGCRYNNWLTSTFGGGTSGDQIVVRIVPARGGLPEQDTSDDVLTGQIDPTYNRSIEHIEFQGSGSFTTIRILYGLSLSDQTTDPLVLNADVEIYVNGVLHDVLAADAEKPASAITCAVTCAGKCPSIFGDGVCTGCGCNYSNWLTSGFGGANEGDLVTVRLVPARRGEPEMHNGDDALTAVFSPPAMEQHDCQESMHFDFWVINVDSTTSVDNFRIANPRLVFENIPGAAPDSTTYIKCCSVLDLSPITPVAPEIWCRVNQDAATPLFKNEAWWFFPSVGPGQMAPSMDVAFSIPASVTSDSLCQKKTWYEVDYFLSSGAQDVAKGIFRFRCDSLVTTDVGPGAFEASTAPGRVLQQNVPNPFNPGTTIRYRVDRMAEVRLFIFNVKGQLVKSMQQGLETPGLHSIRWDGTDHSGRLVPSGTYLYQIMIGDVRESRKMIVLR